MKFKNYIPFLLLTHLIISCAKKEERPRPIPEDETIKVKEYNKVHIDGDVNLHIHYSPGFTEGVKVSSGPYDRSKIIVKSENGELKIHVDGDFPASDIVVDIFVPMLNEIRLENNQHAMVHWENTINISSLDIVTEADSKLEIFNLNANYINSKQEANSRIVISSAGIPLATPLTYTERVVLLNDRTILVDNNLVVRAESITVDNNVSPVVYKVFGPAIGYNLIEAATFNGEGRSSIEISEMPVRDLEIKLEGESKANVWATNRLSGKGEGQTFLSFYGNPTVDYNTSGSARVVQIP